MNALEILRSVLLQTKVPVPSPLSVVSSEEDIINILSIMNNAGEFIARAHEWSTLSHLGVFNLATGVVVVPSDTLASLGYYRLYDSEGSISVSLPDGTIIDNLRSANGVPDAQWRQSAQAAREGGLVYWRMWNGELQFTNNIHTALDEGAPITARLVFQTSFWVVGGANRARVTTDMDTFNIPARLLRLKTVSDILRQLGLPYAEQQAEYEAAFAADILADRGG